jgi:hypothetical protein
MENALNKEQRRNMLTLIRRLESGKYNQVRGTLREVTANGKDIGNCCIGVAANILVEKGVCSWGLPVAQYLSDGQIHLVSRLIASDGDSASAAMFSDDARTYFGLDVPDNSDRTQERFWNMNDSQRKSFPEIAAEMRRAFGFPPRKENANS